ncbi:MAG: hypothetical protein NVSMB70_06460 [Chamaesiphon sp.]
MKSLFTALLVVISIPAFAKGHDYAYHGTHHGGGFSHEKAHGDHGSDLHSHGHGHK